MSDNTITPEDIDRLDEIKNQMLELLDEATQIVKTAGPYTYSRAKSYWIAHITMALSKDHSYLGGSMVTMEETIKALRNEKE